MSLHLNSTAGRHMAHSAPAPADTSVEVVVPQFGPTWVAMVLNGANVRNGNVIDMSTPRHPQEGDRVELSPHLDEWMRGHRFGTVEQVMVNEEGARTYLTRLSSTSVHWLASEDLHRVVNR